jgi:hypothetical protein
MRILVLLVFVSGCSFAMAPLANRDPKRGCSRLFGYTDLTIAAASAVLTTVMLVKKHTDDPCANAVEHCTEDPFIEAGIGLGILVGAIELIQGGYGVSRAVACETERAKLERP